MLIDTAASKQTVVVACPLADAAGVRPGTTFAEARATCDDLIHQPYEPLHDRLALERLGRWMMRFSPVVSVIAPDALALDIGGCERLFGSLDRLRDTVAAAMRRFGLVARVVIAPTVGAAWAAAASPAEITRVETDSLFDTLAPLPVAALRIDPAAVVLLRELGLRTIGQLASVPRDTLPTRFGRQLLLRLDQAFGQVDELLEPLPPKSVPRVSGRFDVPAESKEMIRYVGENLLERLCEDLARRGRGAGSLLVTFVRCRGEPPIDRTITLARPSRDPAVLKRLVRQVLDRIDLGDDVIGLRITAASAPRLGTTTEPLFDTPDNPANHERLMRFVEQLTTRFGEWAVERARLVESHLPERAFRCEPAMKDTPRVETMPGVDHFAPRGNRPLIVLPTPEEIHATAAPSPHGDGRPIAFTFRGKVHQIVRSAGPERIDGLWWEGHEKTRDYYEAEDQTGRCFWLFRVMQNKRWFLHGTFA